MSDIRCALCGEPWDADCLHEIVEERHGPDAGRDAAGRYDQDRYDPLYQEARRLFRREGCRALGGRCSGSGGKEGALAAEILDLLGDDVDGAAATFEDAEALGLF